MKTLERISDIRSVAKSHRTNCSVLQDGELILLSHLERSLEIITELQAEIAKLQDRDVNFKINQREMARGNKELWVENEKLKEVKIYHLKTAGEYWVKDGNLEMMQPNGACCHCEDIFKENEKLKGKLEKAQEFIKEISEMDQDKCIIKLSNRAYDFMSELNK